MYYLRIGNMPGSSMIFGADCMIVEIINVPCLNAITNASAEAEIRNKIVNEILILVLGLVA